MLSIGLRLRYKMPVVIMGETGCGKSSLMRNMCTILSWRLYTLNIHGGMTDGDIIAWMQVCGRQSTHCAVQKTTLTNNMHSPV